MKFSRNKPFKAHLTNHRRNILSILHPGDTLGSINQNQPKESFRFGFMLLESNLAVEINLFQIDILFHYLILFQIH